MFEQTRKSCKWATEICNFKMDVIKWSLNFKYFMHRVVQFRSVIIYKQKFQHIHWPRTRQLFPKDAESWKLSVKVETDFRKLSWLTGKSQMHNKTKWRRGEEKSHNFIVWGRMLKSKNPKEPKKLWNVGKTWPSKRSYESMYRRPE